MDFRKTFHTEWLSKYDSRKTLIVSTFPSIPVLLISHISCHTGKAAGAPWSHHLDRPNPRPSIPGSSAALLPVPGASQVSIKTTQVEKEPFCLAAFTHKQTALPNRGLVMMWGEAVSFLRAG